MLSIPQSATEITPQWLTAALKSTNVLGQEAVISTSVEPIGQDQGFASSVARLKLEYDSENTRAPSSLIAKLSANNDDRERSQILCEQYRREACFYEYLAPELSIRIPRCFYCDYDSQTASIILLLEDLGKGRFGDDAIGWESNDAKLVVEMLARLHADWWCDPRLDEMEWLPTFGTNTAEQLQRLVERREAFLDRHGSRIPEKIIQMVRQLGPQHERLLNRLQGPPRTLLHVDTHCDNLIFLEQQESTETVIYDWQGVARGLCVVDLANFVLGTSVENRRQHELDLQKQYHSSLIEHDIADYPFNQLQEDYDRAILRSWIGTINGLGSSYAANWTGRQADLARQAVDRWCAAVSDHQIMYFL